VKIVLLPGLDGTGVLFRPFVEHLPENLSPIVVSYPHDRELGYSELLPIVLQNLPRNEPFVLLGESFSGPLALMIAATRPPGLKAVVLCATFVRNPTWVRHPWLARLVHPVAFRLYPQFSAAKALLGRYSTLELRTLTREAIAAVSPEVIAHRVRSVLRVNVVDELSDCPVPILYLRGSRDLVVPGRNLREIQSLLPDIRVSTIDAPHMVLQTQPVACVRAIADFVSATESWATRKGSE
jgi:pimeloyl-[acyl-carrier protein] methyl ester esterase